MRVNSLLIYLCLWPRVCLGMITVADTTVGHAHDQMPAIMHNQESNDEPSNIMIMAPIPHRTRSIIPANFQQSAVPTATNTVSKEKARSSSQTLLTTNISLGPTPQLLTCPSCHRPILTICNPVAGRAFTLGMLMSAVLVPVGGMGCFLGAVLAACKPAHDVMHKCPRCLAELGRWRRL